MNTDIIALKIWLNFLGYGIADLYMSVNGGGETHIYRFDTKTNALRADLDSIDHLTFEKGSRVVFLFNNYLDKGRNSNLSALRVCTKLKFYTCRFDFEVLSRVRVEGRLS